MLVNKVYGLLGISSKAGKIVAGTETVIEGINKNQIALVIIAKDTSPKSVQKIQNICKEKNIKILMFGTIEENSKSIRKS